MTDRWLTGVAAALVLAGVGFLAWPADLRGVADMSDARDVAPAARAVTGTDSLAEEVAVANLFAATRTPPRRRYTPPESGGTDSSAAPDSALMSGAAEGTGVSLFGTLVNAGSAQALLQLDGAAGPRLYTVGDQAGGFRVLSIAPRAVVLRGPQGRVVLRLPEEERP